jgi:hypothetical protein
MKTYRCNNCGNTFERAMPGCDACGIDPAANPRLRNLVTELTTVHFDPPTKFRGIGEGKPACDATKKVGGGVVATGDVHSVTCVRCKATAAYQAKAEIMGEGGVAEGQDVVLELDPAKGTIAKVG